MNAVFVFLLIIVKFLSIASESQQDVQIYDNAGKYIKNGRTFANSDLNKPNPPHSKPYFDEPNILMHHMPLLNDGNNKRKVIKKSPRRTIQKIIKRNRSKKKMYLLQAPELTVPPMKLNKLSYIYGQDLIPPRSDNLPTTQETVRKKSKKWNAKVVRYPMPFQKLQSRNIHNRAKRKLERDNVLILQDFDEVEFVTNDNNYNVFNAHVKKYW